MLPILQLIQPLANGLNTGLNKGAIHIRAGVQHLGGTLDQTANAVAHIAGHTVNGAGHTVGHVPAATYQTIRQLERHGVPAQIINTLFGAPRWHQYGHDPHIPQRHWRHRPQWYH